MLNKRNPAGHSGARENDIQADHLRFSENTPADFENQVLTAPDPSRFPIIAAPWPFETIGDAASSFIEGLGQRCIERAEAKGDYEAAAGFRSTFDQMCGDEKGAAA
jgi:hypothetical protein